MDTNFSQTQEFVHLLTSHQEVLRSYVLKMLHGRSDVSDLIQDINMKLWEQKDDFKTGTNFGAWACTLAYYKVLDYRKALKRDGVLVFDDALTEQLAVENNTPDASVAPVLSRKRQALIVCLQGLKASETKLLSTRYATSKGGLDELSARTGRSNGSLRVTLCRLRTKLKHCISERIAMEGGLS